MNFKKYTVCLFIYLMSWVLLYKLALFLNPAPEHATHIYEVLGVEWIIILIIISGVYLFPYFLMNFPYHQFKKSTLFLTTFGLICFQLCFIFNFDEDMDYLQRVAIHLSIATFHFLEFLICFFIKTLLQKATVRLEQKKKEGT